MRSVTAAAAVAAGVVLGQASLGLLCNCDCEHVCLTNMCANWRPGSAESQTCERCVSYTHSFHKFAHFSHQHAPTQHITTPNTTTASQHQAPYSASSWSSPFASSLSCSSFTSFRNSVFTSALANLRRFCENCDPSTDNSNRSGWMYSQRLYDSGGGGNRHKVFDTAAQTAWFTL